MEENYDIIKYYNVLNRLTKKTATYEGLIIIKKQYFTNNFYYYFLCLLTRFVFLLGLSGDYSDIYGNKNNVRSFQSYLKKFSCHNIMRKFNLSQEAYSTISIIIAILYFIRSLMNYHIVKQIKNARETEKWPLPNKYLIIMDHIMFLVFPYIIEFLSFIFYIYFFPHKFIIKSNSEYNSSIFIGMILSLILIIGYNIDNYFCIICSNRKFTKTLFDAYFSEINEKEINKKVSYKCSNQIIYIFIILQNFVIFLTIETYLNKKYKIYFKIICSLLLFFLILIIFFSLSNTYNYSNYINLSISVILFFCFYSIILDLIISISKSLFKNDFNQIMYILIKMVLSFITHIIYKKRTKTFLKKKITEILFQETNNKKERHFVNSFYYLHEIMLKIKGQKSSESAFHFVKFLYNHINNCSKLVCNCKLLKALNVKKYISPDEESNSKDYITNLLIILNYLFESAFIDYEFYNNFDLSLLLSEHFCHLKNNPIMAFSIIKTYLVKQKNKLSKFQIVSVHEIAQKYSYCITSKVNDELERDLKQGKFCSIINKNKALDFKNALIILKITFMTKKFFSNYIIILINLIKYKSIFEESLSFQFDENNENIISAKTNFFEDETKIDGFFNDLNDIKNKGKINGGNNLYNIIHLLSKELIYYNKIIKSINLLENKSIPIFHLFKYFLFFDFFQGGILPNEIVELLNNSFKKELNLFNSYITTKEYSILKKKYDEENNKIDSICNIIFEYKKELRIKYFTESFGLKLGYKQKDLVNNRLDVLLPNDFIQSHQNMVKYLVMGNQIRYYLSKNNYIFDSTSKILYPMDYEGLLIYNIQKHLVIIFKSNFILDNEYNFMLNSNFELLSNSINFQDEYYLNQKILHTYNISLIDLLKIKPDKIRTKFEKEYRRIQHQKLIRKIKTEEYFIPQFYVPPNGKFIGMMNPKYYNTSKNNYLSSIRFPNEEEINVNKDGDTQEEDEEKNLIKNNSKENSINDLLLETETIIFHKTFTTTLNKGIFIENLAKEFTKIPDNDLIFENDKTSYNCIISAKKLISKLLTKSEIADEYLKILVNLTFIYDKPFYFIKINDEKKQYLKISKGIHFGSSKKNIIVRKRSSQANNKNKITFNKKDNNSRNKALFPKKKTLKKKEQNIAKNDNNEKDNLKTNETLNNTFINKIVKKINQYKEKINKDKLILSIKVILSLIILIIIILYIILNDIQGTIRSLIKQILLSYFYNAHTRDTFLNINSKLLQIYYDYFNLATNELLNPEAYQSDIYNLSNDLKDGFHNFTNSYVDYNLLIGHSLNSLFKPRKFNKLRGYWQEIKYESEYSTELNYIIYNVYGINVRRGTSFESQFDFEHFFNFKERADTKEKINTTFIKLLYYFCVNLENYVNIFKEIEDEIYESYKAYLKSKMILYISLGLLHILLYILFFIVVIYYLYYNNEIIFKNIVFLFLDLSEQEYDKNNINNNVIRLKLDEFKNIIEDFDLNHFEKYSKNLDNLERNKFINLRIKEQNNYILENNQEQFNNDNIIPKKTFKLGIKGEEKENSSKNVINDILDDKNLSMKDKGILNNSSHNYLVNANSNNKLLKNSINNNSINASHDFLMNSSTNNSKKNINNKSLKNTDIKQNDEINDIDAEENYQDLILDKLNRSKILMMKVFLAITILLLLLILFSNFFTIYTFSNYINLYSCFFQDFFIITNRYTLLYYFYNALRMMIITPNIEVNLNMANILETLNEYYEEQNNKFNEIISSINNYKEIRNLYYILKESQSNSTTLIKEKICEENEKCISYLESKHNIVDSGIDFGYKTSITLIGNMYMDYKNLDDKKNLTKIKLSVIKIENSQFNDLSISLSNCFLFVKEKIFQYFFIDEENFRNVYIIKISNLNINSFIISIVTLVFTFYVFITISGYTRIIKEASCRVNSSFFYIKNYTIK